MTTTDPTPELSGERGQAQGWDHHQPFDPLLNVETDLLERPRLDAGASTRRMCSSLPSQSLPTGYC